jgi:magnesium transporter
MIERYFHNKITWLDVVSPTQEEIHSLLEECNIPREFAGDLATPTPRTEVFTKNGFLKITLDFPIVKRTDINHPHEVKFLVTKTHLITIRFEDITAIHKFSKEFEMVSMLKGKSKTSAESIFLSLLNLFYEALYEKLDYLDSRLKDIEEEIFKDREEAMVFDLSQVSRRLISFKQTIDAHENALRKLPQAMKDAFGKNHDTTLEAVIHHYEILVRRLQALTSTFVDLRETNNSLLETRQNKIMLVFTVIAFITFPLMLFTSMFGMNTTNTPLVGHPLDFWIILMIMTVISIAFYIFFKYKKWL